MASVVCDGCGDVDLAGAGGQLEKPWKNLDLPDTVSTSLPWDIPEEGEGDHRNNVVISIEAAIS